MLSAPMTTAYYLSCDRLVSPDAGVFGFGWWYYPPSEGATALA